MMQRLLEAWRTWRLRSRLFAEAKHLVTEARHILDRKGQDIPRAVVTDVEGAVAAVETARKANDLESLRHGLVVLDERMDQHLAFARKSTVREYSESIAVAVAIALLLRAFVIEAFQIPSGSMIPTLEIGDHIFVSKFAYGIGIPFTDKKILSWHQPQRGDVIVFKYPHDTNTDYIKRVVGLPGDKVEVRHNEIFINGNPMARELVNPRFSHHECAQRTSCELWLEHLGTHTHNTLHQAERLTEFGPVVVPSGSVFVMGDNRDNSNDSRVWGTVRFELIKGRALIVWWSRDPDRGGWTPAGVAEWFASIRFKRFFHLVE
jgi:signal peptidase I